MNHVSFDLSTPPDRVWEPDAAPNRLSPVPHLKQGHLLFLQLQSSNQCYLLGQYFTLNRGNTLNSFGHGLKIISYLILTALSVQDQLPHSQIHMITFSSLEYL